MGMVNKTHYSSFDAMVQDECIKRGITQEKALGIALSTRPTKDYHYDVEGDRFDVYYHKNSPFNGKQLSNGRIIRNAQCAVGDRTQKTYAVAARVLTRNGKLLCCTGRPDSQNTAHEVGDLLLSAARKDRSDPKTFAVLDLMTPTPISKYNHFDEHASVCNEDQALKSLETQPYHFVIPTNLGRELCGVLPDALTGADVVKKINKCSDAQFKKQLTPNDKKLAEDIYYFLENKSLQAEEEILLRILLCRLSNIPIIIHCKSSTDRTTVGTAIAAILDSWNKPFPVKNGRTAPHLILQAPEVKEQFYQHVKANLPTTIVARGKQGYTWGHKWSINPSASRMLPERFTQPNKNVYVARILVILLSPITLLIGLLSIFTFKKEYMCPLLVLTSIHSVFHRMATVEVDPKSGLLNHAL